MRSRRGESVARKGLRSAVLISKTRSGVGPRSVCSAPKVNVDCEAVGANCVARKGLRSAVLISKTRSGVGPRSVCSAPKVNVDCEAVGAKVLPAKDCEAVVKPNATDEKNKDKEENDPSELRCRSAVQ